MSTLFDQIQSAASSSSSPSTTDLVDRIIEKSVSYRHKGVTEGLLPFPPISVNEASLLKSDPKSIVISAHEHHNERNFTSEDIVERLRDKIPFLDNLKLGELGLVLAGGCFSSLTRREHPSDFDLFFVGVTEEKAIENIKILATRLSEYSSNDENDPMIVFRSLRCITFRVSPPHRCSQVFQVILRLYDTPAELLHSFDLGPCQVLYAFGKLLTTEMGIFCFQHDCVIPVLESRKASFERRLAKYFNRGFDVILPHFLEHATDRRRVRCATFEVSRYRYGQNFIPTPRHMENPDPLAAEELESNYSYPFNYENTTAIIRSNIRTLQQENPNINKLLAFANYNNHLDLFHLPIRFLGKELLSMVNTSSFACVKQTYKLAGAEAARRMGALYLEREIHNIQTDDYQSGGEDEEGPEVEIMNELAESLNAKAAPLVIPFQFEKNDVFNRSSMTYKEWYAHEEEAEEDTASASGSESDNTSKESDGEEEEAPPPPEQQLQQIISGIATLMAPSAPEECPRPRREKPKKTRHHASDDDDESEEDSEDDD